MFDLRAKVTPKSFALDPNERTGHRLVLDLFDDAVEKTKQPETEDLTPATKSVDELAGRRDIIIAIDAGHGGEDPGASGPKKLREKDVVLKIARKLHARLAKTPGFKPLQSLVMAIRYSVVRAD